MDRGPLSTPSCIHRLHVAHAIPASVTDPGAVHAWVAAAAGPPLREALTTAFDGMVASDPDAVWVFRSLQVDSTVPLTVTDPEAIAARIADAVQQAVRRAVAMGPSSCVRFASRAAFVAAFARAVLDGAEHAWAFRRLAVARGLPPATALVVAARLAGADLVDVVVACADEGAWEPLVSRSTSEEAALLVQAVRAAHPPIAATGEQRARVDALAADVARISGPLPRSAVALLALGRALRTDGNVPGLILAATDSVDGRPAPAAASALPATDLNPSATTVPAGSTADASDPSFASPGAAAFLLATSLPAVADRLDLPWIALDDDAGAATRIELLSRVLHVSRRDPAVELAAGWRPTRLGTDPPAILAANLDAVTIALAGHDDADALGDDDRAWLTDDREDDPAALAGLAAHLGRHFTSRLVGFRSSPFAYLVPRLFGAWGVVAVDDSSITVEIEAPPLLVVLAIAGLADFVTTLPWLPELVVVRHEVRG